MDTIEIYAPMNPYKRKIKVPVKHCAFKKDKSGKRCYALAKIKNGDKEHLISRMISKKDYNKYMGLDDCECGCDGECSK